MPKTASGIRSSSNKKASGSSGLIHPLSRKALHISQKHHHKSRVERRKEETNIKLQVKIQKLKWFQDEIRELEKITAQDILDLIEKYFHRFNEELEQIKIIQGIRKRQGSQHASRADSIKFTIDTERNEFESVGIELPDLLNPVVFEFFRNWDGDARYLPKLHLKRVKLNDLQAS